MATKDTYIRIRLSRADKEKISHNAKTAKMNISEYILTLTQRKRIIVINDFYKFIYEIGKIGVNINQITKVANSQKYINKEQLDSVLQSLDSVNKNTSKIIKLICEAEKDNYPTMPTTTNLRLENIETLLYQLTGFLSRENENGSG